MTVKHIHKLKKHRYKTGVAIYFCILDCNFKVEAPLALGKEVLCNICGESFIMNEYSLKLSKPHCNNCGKVKIKDSDGKSHFINKRKSDAKILSEIAGENVNDLRSRLTGIVQNISGDDI